MFKKLRLQFLLLIMGMITVVMAISFIMVYTIINQNIVSENHQRLDDIIETYHPLGYSLQGISGFDDDSHSFI